MIPNDIKLLLPPWLQDVITEQERIPFGSSALMVTKNHKGAVAKVEGTISESWKFKPGMNREATALVFQTLKDIELGSFSGATTFTVNSSAGNITQVIKTENKVRDYLK